MLWLWYARDTTIYYLKPFTVFEPDKLAVKFEFSVLSISRYEAV
jgi:hypothetical protein